MTDLEESKARTLLNAHRKNIQKKNLYAEVYLVVE